ncbi:MAG TPA: SDR family NAD(P)-dependent oxidoreductase, partial [Verrucomicrobiae bacterium]|nr:SDR family NAD(P)-dependent oxidoreductase [Verrucomicrobiae bacterium]
MFDLSGKVAVVTGAGSGIGEAIARVFAEAGAAVFVLDRDAAAAKRAAEPLRGAQAITTDVSDETSVNQAVGDVFEKT